MPLLSIYVAALAIHVASVMSLPVLSTSQVCHFGIVPVCHMVLITDVICECQLLLYCTEGAYHSLLW